MGGRLTFSRPPAPRRRRRSRAGCCPGLVDAHCHVGIGPHGRVDDAVERGAGARRPRRAGRCCCATRARPRETRWIDEREDLPRIVRAGRHLARTRRYLRGLAHEIEPEDLVEHVRVEARRGDGWVKLVGDWIDRTSG